MVPPPPPTLPSPPPVALPHALLVAVRHREEEGVEEGHSVEDLEGEDEAEGELPLLPLVLGVGESMEDDEAKGVVVKVVVRV